MKYLLLIYGPEPEGAAAGDLPAEVSAPWAAYQRSLVDAGIHRGGDRLVPSGLATTVRVRDGRTLLTDGPFAETKEVLGGYYLIEVDDLDGALDAAARCPGALTGSIEVRPIIAMAVDPGVDGPIVPAS